jgi:membrane-associated phospholipid phosphatase
MCGTYFTHFYFKSLFRRALSPLGKLNPEISIKRSNVGRSRSKIFFSKGFNILDLRLIDISGFSFPSGHAMGSTSFFGSAMYIAQRRA